MQKTKSVTLNYNVATHRFNILYNLVNTEYIELIEVFFAMVFPPHLFTPFSIDLPSNFDVSLPVYDVRGRLVSELVSGMKEQGSYVAIWDAADQASGVYFMKLVAGTSVQTQKVMLVK